MSVLRTFAGTFATKGAGFFLTFLVGLMVSRTLGPAGKGQVDVLVIWATLLLMLAYPSLEEPQLVLMGRKRAAPGTLFANGLLAAVLFGGLVQGAFLAVCRWMPEWLSYTDRATLETRSVDTDLLQLLVFVAPLVVMHRVLGGILQGLRDMKSFNLAHLALSGSLALGILVFVVVLGWGVRGAVIAHMVSMGLAGVVAGVLCLRHAEVSIGPLRPDLGALLTLFRGGVRLHGGVVAAWVILISDQLILNRYFGDAAVGRYALAVALTGHLRRLILQPTKEVVGSRLPELMGQPQYLAESLAKTCRHLIVLTVVPGLGLAAFGYPILLLYGPGFTPAYPALLCLVPASLFWAVAVILSYWLIGTDRFLTLTGVGVLIAGSNIGLNFLFVPDHGMVAAALTSTACYALHMTIFLGMVNRSAKLGFAAFLIPRREDFGVYRQIWARVTAKLRPPR